MPNLHLDHVSKRYRRRDLVLQDINLILDGRELVGLLGPPNSGKSMLLRLISGIEKASAGAVYLDGVPISKNTPKSGEVAMVFQNHALYPRMTIRENIAYSLKLQHRPAEEIQTEVERVAELFGLAAVLEKKPNAVSAEQRQAAALARAVVRKPKIVLLDESFTNLDAAARRRMWQMLRQAYQLFDATFIYATHDPVEAMSVGTKLMILREGQILQWGPPQEIFARPANTFVAGLIGAPPMNFWKAEVAASEYSGDGAHADLLCLDIKGLGRLTLSEETAGFFLENVSNGREIIVGARPEQISLQQGGPLCASACFYETEGVFGYLYLESQGAQAMVQMDSGQEPELGEEYHFTIDEADLHFFDADTGERLGCELAG